MRIADFDPENRPRERFITHGPAALSSAELLAIVLRTGTRKNNILDTCNTLLSLHGLEALANMNLKELQKTSGIGPSKAMQITAIFELNKRLHYKRNTNRKIQGARDVYEYMQGRVPDETKEHLFVLHLNTKNQITKCEEVTIGTLNASLIHPREVFKAAIRESANAIILVHNHPSGDTEPSNADRQVTNLLKQASAVIQIDLLDHVIIGKTGWYSFRENNQLS
ncbi:JAB domain-containing protein [Chlorobium phaeovibrioides]|uniref:DNA repair protein RadC n=1 Tax=Chlorobium phaeovibrioides TaxID=1094 RepID=A0A3S0NA41_CHLPH|nr:DNA repair protein RadC [Chlorobium phaeovibrioides]KAA6232841.1 JAB domain-containing protein [Chlorobium phaeovibrioides]MWV54005.1 DNA repair protein RadC [Chlorobium phaeovibrioides]QEQ56763.1 JAB domain-containing protein [Chlorobium phaeovibrioides]RTY37198.1 JAB domain-containing protein [Chlorobium phaeovibrioides]RTY37541.1 JAB domain-containing protein [Chlorobium phaeovibrioides]